MEQDGPRIFRPERASENPKDRIGQFKPPLHLVPPAAEVLEAVVMGLGARKYGPFNWRTADVRATVYVAAAKRHLAQWLDGQDDDPESGVSHLAHARACLGILLDASATGHLIDDRPEPGAASALIERHTAAAGNHGT
ncbi:MAG: dATP/dGTP diphosphohydrolase domain-containing protein [Planctomycetaceae bacterium]